MMGNGYFFWKRLHECLDTGLKDGITRSLISSSNHLGHHTANCEMGNFSTLYDLALEEIFTVAKQMGSHVGNDTLCGEADKSRSYRSECLGSNRVHCNFISFFIYTTSPETQCPK